MCRANLNKIVIIYAIIIFFAIIAPCFFYTDFNNIAVIHDLVPKYKNFDYIFYSPSLNKLSPLAFSSSFYNSFLNIVLANYTNILTTFYIPLALYCMASILTLKIIIVNKKNKIKSIFSLAISIFIIYFGYTSQVNLSSGVSYNLSITLTMALFVIHLFGIRGSSINNIFLLLLLESACISLVFFIPILIYSLIMFNYKIRPKAYEIISAILIIITVVINYKLLTYNNNFSGGQQLFIASDGGYGHMQGGYLYQFLGFNNWTNYVVWDDRLFNGFIRLENDYIYICIIFIINSISLMYFWYKRDFRIILIIALYLIFSVGSQGVFGQIYIYLVDNIPGFSSVRTPDTKFGFFLQSIFVYGIFCLLNITISKKVRYFILFLLCSLVIKLFFPLISAKTQLGIRSLYQPLSTYLVDGDENMYLASFMGENSKILLVPGQGNITLNGKRVGYNDPMTYYHGKTYNYSQILLSNSLNYKGIINSFNYILIRNGTFKDDLNLSNFSLIYKDADSEIFKNELVPTPLRNAIKFSDHKLYFIMSGFFMQFLLLIILTFIVLRRNE